jgi:tRNA(Ile)-lysidine synthase TilS/MesJ
MTVKKVIPPLYYINEETIIDFIKSTDFPITENKCPAKESDRIRVKIKNLLDELSQEFPGIKSSILSSIANLDTRHLRDSRYWDDRESK